MFDNVHIEQGDWLTKKRQLYICHGFSALFFVVVYNFRHFVMIDENPFKYKDVCRFFINMNFVIYNYLYLLSVTGNSHN